VFTPSSPSKTSRKNEKLVKENMSQWGAVLHGEGVTLPCGVSSMENQKLENQFSCKTGRG